MNILHVTVHMGDGAGKAIGGLAVLGSSTGCDSHKILLLDEPKKKKHIEYCWQHGVEILMKQNLNDAISWADIVVLSWWGGAVMEAFLRDFPRIPCRVVLWSHKNGFYDPPLPEQLVARFDHFMVTSPLTQTKPAWENSTLVYGFGNFAPENVIPKTDYSIDPERFVVGYVGMPSYKRLPDDAIDYFLKAIHLLPNIHFVLAGEYSEEFVFSLEKAGLREQVELTGWTSDVYALLRTFDVFGYLLRGDTSATTENSVLEAMSVGLPIVMNRYPVGNYVLGEENGILVDSPTEYAQALKAFYDSQELRRQKGLCGRNRACQENGQKNMAQFRKACLKVMDIQPAVHRFV